MIQHKQLLQYISCQSRLSEKEDSTPGQTNASDAAAFRSAGSSANDRYSVQNKNVYNLLHIFSISSFQF